MFRIENFWLFVCMLEVIYRSLDIFAAEISVNQNVSGLVGNNDTHLKCSFTKDIEQNFINIAIIARNKNGIKEPVAIFQPGKVAILPQTGDYLSGRVTLTNITMASTDATMTFNNLKCEDEKDYICTFNYVNDSGLITTVESEPTMILVKAKQRSTILVRIQIVIAFPSMPDSISYVVVSSIRIEKQDNISSSTKINGKSSSFTLQTDTVTLTNLQSTARSFPIFREGEIVQFSCTGNIGKPPGRFVWQLIPQQEEPMVCYNETTDAKLIPDICSFRGTSNLTVQITVDHFKAKFRCFEESQADIQGMFVETDPLYVSYPVRHINITKQPNQAQYDENTPTITLTCKGDGNPEPTYKWFRQENTRIILSSTNTHIIEDAVQINSGVYICEAYNTIDDIEYNANYSVEIYIVDELWSSKEPESLKISAEYAAYVIPVLCVVVITMICFAVRKHHCKREKGKISSLLDASVIYAEVNEHTKLKYRLKNNQATSLNPEYADVEDDLMERANKVSGDPRFKYNMITGKLEVYSNV